MSLWRKNRSRWATKSRSWRNKPRRKGGCTCFYCVRDYNDYRNYVLNTGSRKIRKQVNEVAFEAQEQAWQAEDFGRLGLPTLDYRDYMDVRLALEQHETPEVFLNFMVDIDKKSGMLQDRTYTQGLIAVANNSDSWIRTPEDWYPEAISLDEHFAELLRHLFCCYDVPRFMDAAWLEGNPTYQTWFKHIGAGQNIRTAPGLPFVLTKKMAHHFLDAPEDYTITEALRWGQVHGLGGTLNFAGALRDTYLVSALNGPRHRHAPPGDFWFEADSFWVNFIRFFAGHPMFDFSQIGVVIDYIREQKYGDPEADFPPEHPNFSLSRRTPESLLDAARAWRAEIRRMEAEIRRDLKREGNAIPSSGIGEFSLNEDGKHWHIRELQTRQELRREGRIMRHCVGTYWNSCRRGHRSIWTMETAGRKVVTIAVDNTLKKIIDARGKANRSIFPEERHILSRWAKQEGLQIRF